MLRGEQRRGTYDILQELDGQVLQVCVVLKVLLAIDRCFIRSICFQFAPCSDLEMLGHPVSEDAEHPEGRDVAGERHPAAGGLLEVVLGAGRVRRVSASRRGHGKRHRGVG